MSNRVLLRLLRLFGHQHWIATGVRNRIIRYFIDPHAIENIEFKTKYFGMKYKGNLKSIIDWYIYFYGAHEINILFLMKNLVKKRPTPTFIDVGANIGSHSLFMSKFCRQVHSFEPYQKVRDQLIRNMTINNISNIIIHDAGLGAEDEYRDFYAPADANEGEGSFLTEHKGDNVLIGKMKIVKGDSYISKLQLDNIDIIKIDVEGYEKEVLIGFKNTLKKYLPFILLEYSLTTKQRLSLSEMIDLLPQGYTIKEVAKNRRLLMVFNQLGYHLMDIDFAKKGGMDLLLLPPGKE